MSSTTLFSWAVYIGAFAVWYLLLRIYGNRQSKTQSSKLNWCILALAVGFLTVFATFRFVTYGIGGTDASTYINEFNSAPDSLAGRIDFLRVITLGQREPLYYVLIWATKKLSSDYHFMFFVVYLFIAACYTRFAVFVAKQAGNKFWLTPVIVFVLFVQSFNIMRCAIAIALCMLAIEQYYKKKKLTFIILTVVAAGFHYIALVLLLILLEAVISHIKLKIHNFPLAVGAALLMYLFSAAMGSIISAVLRDTKYYLYLGNASNFWGKIPTIFILLLVAWFSNELIKQDKRNTTLVVGAILSAGLLYIQTTIGMWRIGNVYILFSIFALSELYELFEKKYGAISAMTVGLDVFMALYAYTQFDNLIEASGIFPYVFPF